MLCYNSVCKLFSNAVLTRGHISFAFDKRYQCLYVSLYRFKYQQFSYFVLVTRSAYFIIYPAAVDIARTRRLSKILTLEAPRHCYDAYAKLHMVPVRGNKGA